MKKGLRAVFDDSLAASLPWGQLCYFLHACFFDPLRVRWTIHLNLWRCQPCLLVQLESRLQSHRLTADDRGRRFSDRGRQLALTDRAPTTLSLSNVGVDLEVEVDQQTHGYYSCKKRIKLNKIHANPRFTLPSLKKLSQFYNTVCLDVAFTALHRLIKTSFQICKCQFSLAFLASSTYFPALK